MVAFVLNGESVDVDVPANTTLLEMLSMDLNQYGPKFGCGLSQCGSCTVLVDGDPVASCETDATAVTGRSVETLAALR